MFSSGSYQSKVTLIILRLYVVLYCIWYNDRMSMLVFNMYYLGGGVSFIGAATWPEIISVTLKSNNRPQ